MSAVVLALVVIGILMLLSVPIAVCIGLGSVCYYIASAFSPEMIKFSLMMVPLKMFSTVDNFTLLAIPLFLLGGSVMNTGGITARLFQFAKKMVGHIKGGLGHVCVVSSIIFAGMSGSATADACGLGSIEIPEMKKEGYDTEFAASIILGSSVIAPIIPPSIIMVIYGVTAQVSVGSLFLAGIIPGLITGLALMLYVYFTSKKRNYPSYPRATFKEMVLEGIKAFPVLLTPIIIIGGIYSGFFTPTEAAMIAVFYSLILGFIYKEMSWKKLWQITRESAVNVGVLMFIIGITGVFGWWLSFEQIPQMLTNAIYGLTQNPLLVLLLISLVILIEGCFLDSTPIVLIMVPILMPLLQKLNIDLVYFGILISLNTMIGLTTPPVGVCLFGISGISKLPIEKLVKAYLPVLGVLVLVLLFLTLVPQVTTFLPNLLLGN